MTNVKLFLLFLVLSLFLTACREQTGNRILPDGSKVQVDAKANVVKDKRTEAAEKAISSIKPEDLQAVKGEIRCFHFQLNDLIAWGHYRRFKDNGNYLWEE
ncbi:MAG TPA: hypothetical protein GXX40_02815 [Firmicutes bacterium]|nr:hypothetical protein [Bacillota bacterium]